MRNPIQRLASHADRIRRHLGAALALFDAADWHFYGGLAIAAAGGVRHSASWTLVVVGAVLALVGLRGGR